MNQNVSPAAAFSVLALLCVFIAAMFHFNEQALTVDRVSLMAQHPDGNTVVMLGNDLYKLDPATGSEQVIALDALGIAATVGGFAFFSNGDLLAVADEYRPTLWQSLAIWRRAPNLDYASTEHNQLLRCDLAAQSCRRFSSELPDFTRTFRLFIDQRTDEVYIADTSRHRVVKLDTQGKQLAAKSDFKFPNQLKLIAGELWLADTNHHQVKRIDTALENFGDSLEAHETKLGFGHQWPSDLIKVGEDWWVLVMDQGMRNGKLVMYDRDWHKLKSVALPLFADPIALQLAGDRVLVTDYGNFAIDGFSLSGERIENPPWPQLNDYLASAEADHEFYNIAVWATRGALFLLIAVGLLYALIKQAKNPAKLAGQPPEALSAMPLEGVWVQQNKALKAGVNLIQALACLGLLAGVALYFTSDIDARRLPLLLAISLTALCLFPLANLLKKMLRARLGLFEDRVVFVNGDGEKFQAAYRDIKWGDGGVVIETCVVPLPHGSRQGIFVGETIDKLLLPRLLPENRIGQWAMFKYQWHSPDKNVKYITIFTAVLCFLALAFKVRQLLIP
jgi:sugar lactone lactonase YvrE